MGRGGSLCDEIIEHEGNMTEMAGHKYPCRRSKVVKRCVEGKEIPGRKNGISLSVGAKKSRRGSSALG